MSYLRETGLDEPATALSASLAKSGHSLPANVPANRLDTLMQLAMRQAHDVPSAPSEAALVEAAAAVLGGGATELGSLWR